MEKLYFEDIVRNSRLQILSVGPNYDGT